MIHPTSKVHYLDIKLQKGFLTSIDDLYKQYIEYSIQVNDPKCISKIDFRNTDHNIKICDFYGWSQLLYIEKVNVSDWVRINVHKDRHSIIIAKGECIPSYNPNQIPMKGFHGELKYQYDLKPVELFTKDDTLRAWNLLTFIERYSCNCGSIIGKCNENHICSNCKSAVKYMDSKDLEFWHPSSIDLDCTDHNEKYGYKLFTKSGYVNVNKFYLYTNYIN